MKRSKTAGILLFAYGIFISITAVPGFIGELISLPGAYKLLVWSWLPLLLAYWLYLRRRSFGKQMYWRLAVSLAILCDLFLNFYVSSTIMGESVTSWMSVVGVLFLLPLYVISVLYAFGRHLWTRANQDI